MIHYLAIKSIAIVLGLCSMFVAFVIFIVDLVQSITNEDPTNDVLLLSFIILLLLSAAFTMAGPTFIFKKRFQTFYIPFCILLGLGYLSSYLFSSTTISFDFLLLVMAFLYFLLAYLGHIFSVE